MVGTFCRRIELVSFEAHLFTAVFCCQRIFFDRWACLAAFTLQGRGDVPLGSCPSALLTKGNRMIDTTKESHALETKNRIAPPERSSTEVAVELRSDRLAHTIESVTVAEVDRRKQAEAAERRRVANQD